MGRGCNGLEFIAYALPDWLQEKAIKIIYITPDSPWENPHIESFHDKFWDKLLNRELFNSPLEAKVLVEAWRIQYTQSRPYSSHGYLTPRGICGALRHDSATGYALRSVTAQ